MRSLSRAARIFFWGLTAAWIVSLLRRLTLIAAPQNAVWQVPVVAKAIPLHRDPWCGTYVSPEVSFPLEEAGRIEHFCSRECLKRHAASRLRVNSA